MFYRVYVCGKKNFKTKGNLTNQKRGRFIFLSFPFVLNAGSIFRKQKNKIKERGEHYNKEIE